MATFVECIPVFDGGVKMKISQISEQILLKISLQTSWKLNYVTCLQHIIGECEGYTLNRLKFFCLKDRLLDNCDT